MPWRYRVRTDKDTHFTGAITQHAREDENILLPGALDGMNGKADGVVRSLSIWSEQNLSWEVMFWKNDQFNDTDPDVDAFLGIVDFVAPDGFQLGGSGLYYYYVDGLDILYHDEDKSGELHVSLVNRTFGTDKIAGSGGYAVIEFGIQPMGPEGGWQ